VNNQAASKFSSVIINPIKKSLHTFYPSKSHISAAIRIITGLSAGDCPAVMPEIRKRT